MVLQSFHDLGKKPFGGHLIRFIVIYHPLILILMQSELFQEEGKEQQQRERTISSSLTHHGHSLYDAANSTNSTPAEDLGVGIFVLFCLEYLANIPKKSATTPSSVVEDDRVTSEILDNQFEGNHLGPT